MSVENIEYAKKKAAELAVEENIQRNSKRHWPGAKLKSVQNSKKK